MITIRQATSNDLADIIQLFQETIEVVNANDYSAEQVKAWKSGASKKEKWVEKISQQYFLLAEMNADIAGFASMTNDGYLDFLYVGKYHQRMGVAQALYNELEEWVKSNHLYKIVSDVSITAKPFFEKQNFTIVKEQQADIDGIKLTNYKMEKHLNR